MKTSHNWTIQHKSRWMKTFYKSMETMCSTIESYCLSNTYPYFLMHHSSDVCSILPTHESCHDCFQLRSWSIDNLCRFSAINAEYKSAESNCLSLNIFYRNRGFVKEDTPNWPGLIIPSAFLRNVPSYAFFYNYAWFTCRFLESYTSLSPNFGCTMLTFRQFTTQYAHNTGPTSHRRM